MATETSSTDTKIIRQVEYYFGDINLTRDAFLKKCIAESEGGWITMETLLKFKRLQQISKDKDEVLSALKKSTSGILEVGEDAIRRSPNLAVPESLEAELNRLIDQSVYVKGFHADAKLDDVTDYLESNGGPVSNVHMRRIPNSHKFKGSVFAIFKTKEDAEKFLTNPAGDKFKERQMLRKWKCDYISGKEEEKAKHIAEKKKRMEAAATNREADLVAKMTIGALLELSGLGELIGAAMGKKPGSNGEQHKAVENTTDAVKKDDTADDSAIKEEKSDVAVKKDVGDSEMKEESGDDAEKNGDVKSDVKEEEKDDEEESEEEQEQFNSAAALRHLTTELKAWIIEKVGDVAQVAWVDLVPDSGTVIVRFRQENSAGKAWDKMTAEGGGEGQEQRTKFKDAVLTGRLISGEEEKTQWTRILAERSQNTKRHQPGSWGRGGRGRRGRGGRGGGGPPAKRQRRD